jgi:hypothetical protein
MSFYGSPNPEGLENMGKPWKDVELIQLLKEVKMKVPTEQIAAIHKRTLGGIRSRLRYLAVDYYFNNDMPVDQIMVITGLDKDDIINAIQKREYQNEIKDKKVSMKPVNTSEIKDIHDSKSEITDLKDVLALLKSIDKKVSEYIKERSEYGDSDLK